MPVFFHNEDVDFPIQQKNKKKRWLKHVIEHLDFELGNISVVFCSDDYLLNLNKKHLNRNYYTDVITFNYCSNKTISGDIFVSVDRVRAFSIDTNTPFLSEINRVIVHGVLHLCGFDDKKPDEILRMRKLEDLYLTKLKP